MSNDLKNTTGSIASSFEYPSEHRLRGSLTGIDRGKGAKEVWDRLDALSPHTFLRPILNKALHLIAFHVARGRHIDRRIVGEIRASLFSLASSCCLHNFLGVTLKESFRGELHARRDIQLAMGTIICDKTPISHRCCPSSITGILGRQSRLFWHL